MREENPEFLREVLGFLYARGPRHLRLLDGFETPGALSWSG